MNQQRHEDDDDDEKNRTGHIKNTANRRQVPGFRRKLRYPTIDSFVFHARHFNCF